MTNPVPVVIVCLLTASALAGDLNPPPGPVAPTMKTLDTVEPRIAINAENTPGDADSVFRITAPGSYYLTGNAQHTPGERCIEIASSNVTVDLNGFQIFGFGAGNLEAVAHVNPVGNAVVVKNGSIISSEGGGVILTNVSNARVENVVVQDATDGDGIRLGGGGHVSGCSVTVTGGFGIRVSTGSIEMSRVAGASSGSACFEIACCGSITACHATGSAGDGFSVDSDVVVSGCVATATRRGFVSALGGAVFRDCNANFCSQRGFETGADCVIESCVAKGSADDGFLVSGPGTIRGCVANQSGGVGFELFPGSIVSGCTSDGNGGNGFQLAFGETPTATSFTNCAASENSGSGFVSNSHVTYTGCASVFNQGDGFNVTSRCNIVDCNASANDTLGVRGFISVSVQRTVVSSNGTGGIVLERDGVVRDCDVSVNGGIGIVARDECEVIGSRVARNTDIGIEMRNRGVVRGSTVNGHSNDSGIIVTGEKCVIEGCTLSDNLGGIELAGAANAMIDGNRINRSTAFGIFLDSSSQTCDVVRNLINQSSSWIVNTGISNDIAPLSPNAGTAGPWDNLQL